MILTDRSSIGAASVLTYSPRLFAAFLSGVAFDAPEPSHVGFVERKPQSMRHVAIALRILGHFRTSDSTVYESVLDINGEHDHVRVSYR